MRRAALMVVALAALAAAIVGLSEWQDWGSAARTASVEAEWVAAYASWFDDVDRTVVDGRPLSIQECRRRFRRRVGDAPTERLEPLAEAGVGGCAALGQNLREDAWLASFGRVAHRLTAAHARSADPSYEADLSSTASAISGRKARVFCWLSADWATFAEQNSLLYGEREFWTTGLAEPDIGRIDLAPEVCDPVRRFLRSLESPYLDYERYDLAEGLVTLAHEAEHLRNPGAPENVVECYALQRVRGMVADAGRKPKYGALLARIAWDVGYPRQLDTYRTEKCHDAGPLDLHPGSHVWP